MMETRTDDGFLIGRKYTATDIYCIEDMFDQIKIMEDRIKQLLATGHSACDEIRWEFVCLISVYESLGRMIQKHGESIENDFGYRLREVGIRLNKLIKRAGEWEVTVKKNCLRRG